jgi:hypothetical protein
MIRVDLGLVNHVDDFSLIVFGQLTNNVNTVRFATFRHFRGLGKRNVGTGITSR